MTPEAQRIAIAKYCGFYVHREGEIAYISRDPKPNWDHRVFQSCPMPDYPDDLNFMHEAEKVLIAQGKQREWVKAMWQVCGSEIGRWNDLADLIHATANQRAEAFLKTIGKWQD